MWRWYCGTFIPDTYQLRISTNQHIFCSVLFDRTKIKATETVYNEELNRRRSVDATPLFDFMLSSTVIKYTQGDLLLMCSVHS